MKDVAGAFVKPEFVALTIRWLVTELPGLASVSTRPTRSVGRTVPVTNVAVRIGLMPVRARPVIVPESVGVPEVVGRPYLSASSDSNVPEPMTTGPRTTFKSIESSRAAEGMRASSLPNVRRA